MNIQMTISVSTETASKVIALLASEGKSEVTANPVQSSGAVQQTVPVQNTATVAQTPAPTQYTAPVQQTPPMQYTNCQPVQNTAPVQQQYTAPVQQTAPVQTAPTSSPVYTINQLQTAIAPLLDAGKVAQIQQLVQSFGVETLMDIPQERYGEFANGLRAIGGVL